MRRQFVITLAIGLHVAAPALGPTTEAGEPPQIYFRTLDDGLVVMRGEEKLARYVFGDERTTRPFFKEVHAPGGHQVSIHNPPKYEADHDHGALHPGSITRSVTSAATTIGA